MIAAANSEIPASATYLRQQAERCVQVARECPHRPTSHELEAIAIELMEKAAEWDRLLGDWPETTCGVSVDKVTR
jgi:hypothetical protein